MVAFLPAEEEGGSDTMSIRCLESMAYTSSRNTRGRLTSGPLRQHGETPPSYLIKFPSPGLPLSHTALLPCCNPVARGAPLGESLP